MAKKKKLQNEVTQKGIRGTVFSKESSFSTLFMYDILGSHNLFYNGSYEKVI